MVEGVAGRRPGARGRPRSEQADRAILDAARRLLAEQGYARMSIEGVAEAAGVGKPTIYRRYRDKAELVGAALARIGGEVTAPIDSGDTRADLTELVERFLAIVTGSGTVIVGTLLAEHERHPELLDAFRERAIEPRRALMRELLERGIRRGEIRPDADLDLATDQLIGPYFARRLSREPIPPDWAREIVAGVWKGIAGGVRFAR